MLQKFARPLAEAPFCVGAPVWPNILNMPKSASGPYYANEVCLAAM